VLHYLHKVLKEKEEKEVKWTLGAIAWAAARIETQIVACAHTGGCECACVFVLPAARSGTSLFVCIALCERGLCATARKLAGWQPTHCVTKNIYLFIFRVHERRVLEPNQKESAKFFVWRFCLARLYNILLNALCPRHVVEKLVKYVKKVMKMHKPFCIHKQNIENGFGIGHAKWK